MSARQLQFSQTIVANGSTTSFAQTHQPPHPTSLGSEGQAFATATTTELQWLQDKNKKQEHNQKHQDLGESIWSVHRVTIPDIEAVDPKQLDYVLQQFNAELRKEGGHELTTYKFI